MKSFLSEVATYVYNEFSNKYHEICIVLPGKRGRIFLKEEFRKLHNGPVFLPNIISIEEFLEKVSGLNGIDEISLNLELYTEWEQIMLAKNSTYNTSLREFLKWSNTIIHDFNEVDRSLANPEHIFKNLADIKHIEHWSLGKEELTEFQKRYLEFMDSLGELYKSISAKLLKKGYGWQGLIARNSIDKIENSEFIKNYSHFVFCGFNALNSCEKKIFKYLQIIGKGKFLWDADKYYLEDPKQEAGEFLRKNFKDNFLNYEKFISDHLIEHKKEIEVVAAAGNMSQALVVNKHLNKLNTETNTYNSTAVILADENLLLPITSTLPETINKVNITLEYPLKLTAMYDLFTLVIHWQSKAEEEKRKSISIYHKDFYRFLNNSCIRNFVNEKANHFLREILEMITKNNIAFISPEWLLKNWPEIFQPLNFLLKRWENVGEALEKLTMLNELVADPLVNKTNLSDQEKLELEYIYSFIKSLQNVKNKIIEYNCIKDIGSLLQIIKDVVGEMSVSYIGEPLNGLQIMGVLESRTLDFENVILVGMNEGKLPSGNSQNSFIPNDLKKYFGLPLTKDKDAVFAYHFYRVLQRAKKITLIYNTETDRFGSGERSRFITQLESEFRKVNAKSNFTEFIATTQVPELKSNEIKIRKDSDYIEIILDKFINKQGLSASSINSFLTCPLKFWYTYIGGIRESESLEEGMESQTFGLILHKCLESIYKPYEDKILKTDDLQLDNQFINDLTIKAFKDFFPEEAEPKGKNLMALSIIKMSIKNQLREDIKEIQQLNTEGKNLKLIFVEKELIEFLDLTHNKTDYKFKVSGRIDRVDFQDKYLRIIDYKSSINYNNDNFSFTDMASLFSNKKNSKLIQLFIYAWLAWKNNLCEPEFISPCLIPFKNYSGTPTYPLDKKKNKIIFTKELLMEFEEGLRNLISRLLDISIQFTQTEDTKKCEYCSYKAICNR
jgi:CRISPR/Cas system-associated exonuclease Cas4 (RecB family)